MNENTLLSVSQFNEYSSKYIRESVLMVANVHCLW